MTWEELLAILVGFVGRKVHAQVWNTADPQEPGAAVVSTTFGILTGTNTSVELALPRDTILVMLEGSSGETSGVLTVSRGAFVSAQCLDANRLEVVLGSVMLGIYAE